MRVKDEFYAIERGQTFKTTTSESGEYVASPLRVGSYKVTVTLVDSITYATLDTRQFDIDVLLPGVPTNQAVKKTINTQGTITANLPGVTASLKHVTTDTKGDSSIIVANVGMKLSVA